MDFSDEHYVKLFTRDTVTWRSWPWQARAVLPLLMRAVDHAGILSVGEREPARSVALMVDMPTEVVAPGLAALLADGTLELVAGSLIITKFNDAQESKKSNAQAKREQREKAKALAKGSQTIELTKAHRQTAADGGRSGHPPSPALPCPTPLKASASREKRAPTGEPAKPKPVKSPPDPRHAPLVKVLCEVYQRKRGASYPFAPRDAKRVQALLGCKPSDRAPALWPVELAGAWARALDSSFPGCSTLEDFERQLAKHLGTGPPAAGPTNQADPNTGIVMRTVDVCVICGAGASAQAGMPKQWFCYGQCLEGANDFALRVNPNKPWTVDLGPWVADRRAGAMIGTEAHHAS